MSTFDTSMDVVLEAVNPAQSKKCRNAKFARGLPLMKDTSCEFCL